MPFPVLIAAAGSVAGLVGLAIYDAVRGKSNPGIGERTTVRSAFPGLRHPSDPAKVDQVRVTLPNGEVWEVAPEMIGPVGIGEAADIAKSMGLQLPSSELVDAIWNAADMKVVPPLRSHDGTPRTMSSPDVYEKQRVRIEDLIGGRHYGLLAGTHKDVIMLPNGKPGLYGWNVGPDMKVTVPTHAVRGASGVPVKAGRVIQQEFGGHGLDWKDYSQGLRLVRKVG